MRASIKPQINYIKYMKKTKKLLLKLFLVNYKDVYTMIKT